MKNQLKPGKEHNFSPESKTHTLGMILVLLIILLILKASKANAQVISTSMFTEKAVMGQQVGASIGVKTEGGLFVGGFYQRNINNLSEISPHGYELAGITVSQYLIGNQKVALAPMLRLGVSDRQQMIMIPGLKASAQIKDRLSLHFSSSIRASQATMMIGLSIDMPTRIKNYRPRYL